MFFYGLQSHPVISFSQRHEKSGRPYGVFPVRATCYEKRFYPVIFQQVKWNGPCGHIFGKKTQQRRIFRSICCRRYQHYGFYTRTGGGYLQCGNTAQRHTKQDVVLHEFLPADNTGAVPGKILARQRFLPTDEAYIITFGPRHTLENVFPATYSAKKIYFRHSIYAFQKLLQTPKRLLLGFTHVQT